MVLFIQIKAHFPLYSNIFSKLFFSNYEMHYNVLSEFTFLAETRKSTGLVASPFKIKFPFRCCVQIKENVMIKMRN